MPLNKTHIAASEFPLSAGLDTTALCNEIVREAQWIWTAENGGKAVKEIFNALHRCSKCWDREWEGRYIYGMISGVGQCHD